MKWLRKLAATTVVAATLSTATIILQTLAVTATGIAGLATVFIAGTPGVVKSAWRWIAVRMGI